jgi:two-component system phosphate regulon response regulator OmpR
MDTRILLLDDDALWYDELRQFFTEHGMGVSMLCQAGQLVSQLRTAAPSVILLRDGLPGMSSAAVLDLLRAERYEIPLIVMGKQPDPIEKIVCLELGADDYVEIPCNYRELLSRVKNLLRHKQKVVAVRADRSTIYHFGDFSLDFSRQLLKNLSRGGGSVAGNGISLQGSMFALLQAFAESPMKVLSRQDLLSMLDWQGAASCERSLDVMICRLRRIVEQDPTRPKHIQTVRGWGYVFNPDGGGRPAFERNQREQREIREPAVLLSGRSSPRQYRAFEVPSSRSPA